MKMRTIVKFIPLFLLLVVAACHNPSQQEGSIDSKELKQSMETANRYIVKDEEADIERYICRHGLEMVSTGTGLRYVIHKQGSDQKISEGQTVTMEYVVHSIAGDVVYSSDNEGYKVFKVGYGQAESGLDEAVRYLHKGDVATLILPSHLAYGLHGDDNKIPAYATLIYKIKIIDIQ